MNLTLRILRLLLGIGLGLAFVRIGLLHFQNPEPFEAIVPTYLGWPRFWNFASGGLEIVLGIGLALPPTRSWSARLLTLLVLAMSLANLNMWLNDLPFNGTRLSTNEHLIRWSIQIVLLAALCWLGWPGRGSGRGPRSHPTT
ncbi:MAG: hypothetical protein CMJ23_07610 [Phycisphaerae bacterium]|nr:hypothetical protein [Phycisphaerae bacterium]